VRGTLANELSELSETLIGLYDQLGIPTQNTPAASYLAMSAECYDTSNHQRAAPSGFASKLLKQLRGGGP